MLVAILAVKHAGYVLLLVGLVAAGSGKIPKEGSLLTRVSGISSEMSMSSACINSMMTVIRGSFVPFNVTDSSALWKRSRTIGTMLVQNFHCGCRLNTKRCSSGLGSRIGRVALAGAVP